MENDSINPSIPDIQTKRMKLIFSSLKNGCPPNVVMQTLSDQIDKKVFHLGWLTLSRHAPKSMNEWMVVPSISEMRKRLSDLSLDDCIVNYAYNSLVFLPRMELSVVSDNNASEGSRTFFTRPFVGGDYGYSPLWTYEAQQMRHLLRADFQNMNIDSVLSFERVGLNLNPISSQKVPTLQSNPVSMRIYINANLLNSVKRWGEVLKCEGVQNISDINLDTLLL